MMLSYSIMQMHFPEVPMKIEKGGSFGWLKASAILPSDAIEIPDSGEYLYKTHLKFEVSTKIISLGYLLSWGGSLSSKEAFFLSL